MRKDSPVKILLLFTLIVVLRVIINSDPIANKIQQLTQPLSVSSHKDIGESNGILDPALKAENEKLRSELKFAKREDLRLIGADITAKNTSPLNKRARINRGTDDGIKEFDPVFSEGYLVGYVKNAEKSYSDIVLIGDPLFKATVVVSDTNLNGLIQSKLGGVVISELPSGDNITDKQVLTSGVGELFAPGFLLGAVGDEVENQADIFKTFILEYPFDIYQTNVVLVGVDE